jgi:anti-sigma factor RsiW
MPGLHHQRCWACERARQALSLRLDGELSQLEHVLVEAHCARCPACARFAVDIEAVTRSLRAAPFERLERPIELPVRRFGTGLRRYGAGLAAASAAAAALFGVVGLPAERVQGPPTPVVAPSNNQDLEELRILRRAQMIPSVQRLARPSRGAEM